MHGAQIKRVPGRKSDYQVCHSLGLLSASVRPDAEMVTLRTYLRHRAELIQHRAPHILHMLMLLHPMNLQLDNVLTDITGQTGLAILRAIVAGERDPLKLAQLRHPNCRSSEDTIARALTGAYRDDHLFALKQSLEIYAHHTEKIAKREAQVEGYFSAIKPRYVAPQGRYKLAPTRRSSGKAGA